MRPKRFRLPLSIASVASLVLLAGLALAGCGFTPSRVLAGSASHPGRDAEQKAHLPVLGAKVVKSYPHDPHAFTQGLLYYRGYLYESTGRLGQSTLRKVELQTGKVMQQVSLPPQEFGEGLTVFHGKIYQLTWLSKKGFIYNLESFRQIGEFHYDSEGWGLTHDDTSLILSDGTNTIRFIDPVSFAVTRTIEVYSGDVAVANLNELEYIDGEIFSNVWHSSRIARIDPRSGQVVAWLDLAPLVAKEQRGEEDVLNGIAYDHEGRRLFVTGKDWAEMLEIKPESTPPQP